MAASARFLEALTQLKGISRTTKDFLEREGARIEALASDITRSSGRVADGTANEFRQVYADYLRRTLNDNRAYNNLGLADRVKLQEEIREDFFHKMLGHVATTDEQRIALRATLTRKAMEPKGETLVLRDGTKVTRTEYEQLRDLKKSGINLGADEAKWQMIQEAEKAVAEKATARATTAAAADSTKVRAKDEATRSAQEAAERQRDAADKAATAAKAKATARGTKLDDVDEAIRSGDPAIIQTKFAELRQHMTDKEPEALVDALRQSRPLSPDEVMRELRNNGKVTRQELGDASHHFATAAKQARESALRDADNMPSAMNGLTTGELKKFAAIGQDPAKAIAELANKDEFNKWLVRYRNPLVTQGLQNDVNAAMATLDALRINGGKGNITDIMNEMRKAMRDPARSADPTALTGQIVDFVPRQKPLTYKEAAAVIRNGGPISENEFSQFMGFFRQWDTSVTTSAPIVQQPMMGMTGAFAPLNTIGNLATTIKTLAQPDASPRMAMTATIARQWDAELGRQPHIALRAIDSFRDRPFATSGRTLLYGAGTAAIAGTISAGHIFLAQHGTENRGYWGTLGFEVIHDHLDGVFSGGLTDKGGKLEGESEITSFDYQLLTKGQGVISDKFRDYTARLTGISLGNTVTPKQLFTIATILSNNVGGKDLSKLTPQEKEAALKDNPQWKNDPKYLEHSGLNDANLRGYIAALASKMGWESASKDHNKLPIDADSLSKFAIDYYAGAMARQLTTGSIEDAADRADYFKKYLGVTSLPADSQQLNSAIVARYASTLGGSDLDRPIIEKYLETAMRIPKEHLSPEKIIDFMKTRAEQDAKRIAATAQQTQTAGLSDFARSQVYGSSGATVDMTTSFNKMSQAFKDLTKDDTHGIKGKEEILTRAWKDSVGPNGLDQDKFVTSLIRDGITGPALSTIQSRVNQELAPAPR